MPAGEAIVPRLQTVTFRPVGSLHVVELPPTENVLLSESTAACPIAGAGALTDDVPRAASMRHAPHFPPSQIWTPCAQLTTPSRTPSSIPHSRVDHGTQPAIVP